VSSTVSDTKYEKSGKQMEKIANKQFFQVISKIQNCLSRDLLNPEYQKIVSKTAHPVTGHCYVATEAAFHLFGKKYGYYTYVRRYGSITHWWLQNEKSQIIDVTIEQVGDNYPYHEGHKQNMQYTPSKRARKLIKRIWDSGDITLNSSK
jgi:hypothetical protein